MAKKATAKKRTVKKKVAKKRTARKTTKKATARKTTARKTTARKTTRTAATRKKAAPRKAATKKKAAPKKKAKRKPNPAFMRPMTLSEALGAVVGTKPIPRTEVTKKLWAYIKKNDLQDAVNRRMINADDKLKKVFGGKTKVSMFEMTKLVSKHME
ncbi:MAG: SWIB/MDM2 domain-containing protein [candidate division Zixibacteria bacterium]|nr:SWIB/MDM2 domain-containing protein [candidate division Zixibacteria bacterium]